MSASIILSNYAACTIIFSLSTTFVHLEYHIFIRFTSICFLVLDQIAFTLKKLEARGGTEIADLEVCRLRCMKHFARRGMGGRDACLNPTEKHLSAVKDRFAPISWPSRLR